MKKKLSILLFTIVMVLLMSVSVFAGNTPTTLYVGGQLVSGSGQITGDGISGTVSYDASTGTLTLNNASISSTYKDKVDKWSNPNQYAIYCLGGDLNIVLNGKNEITYNLYGDGEIDVYGPGNLSIFGKTPGTYDPQYSVECESFEIEENATVAVYMTTDYSHNASAIKADGVGVLGTLIVSCNDADTSAVVANKIIFANGSTTKITAKGKAIKDGTTISKGDKIKIVAGTSESTTTTCTVANLAGKKYVEASATAKAAGKGTVPKVDVTGITAGKGSFKLTWTSNSEVDGYQVRYSTNSKMKSAKYKSISSSTAYAFTVSGAKSKTKFYVQIRAFKKVNGKKKYSSWSKKYSVKTK